MVSIIIPCFNRMAYIVDAINSALLQTHKDIEVIVVDDGSTDATMDILAPFIRNKCIRVVEQAHKGVSAARNRGIQEAHGDFIAFLDSDDRWLPSHVEGLHKVLNAHSACGVAFSGFAFFGDAREAEMQDAAFSVSISRTLLECFDKAAEGLFISRENLLETLFKRGFSFRVPASLIRRDFLLTHGLKFEESIHFTEEAQFFSEAALYTRFAYINDASLLIRRHSGNAGDLCYAGKISSSFEVRANRAAAFFKGKLNKPEKRALKSLIRELRIEAVLHRCNDAPKSERLRESTWLLLRAPSIRSLKFFAKTALLRGINPQQQNP